MTQIATLPANSTSYTVTGLAPNSWNCYLLKPFNATGDGPWSPWACAATPYDVAPPASVRIIVVIPSDKTDAPADSVVLQGATTSTQRLAAAFFAKAGGLGLRTTSPRVIRSAHDTLWFTTADVGAAAADAEIPFGHNDLDHGDGVAVAEEGRVYLNFNRLEQTLRDAGLGGYCVDGRIAVVMFATTATNRDVGVGGLCSAPVIQAPDAAPGVGPGTGGKVIISFPWSLSMILNAADTSPEWGVLMHELGHSMGLNHSCEGWEHDNWAFDLATCNGLVMWNAWAYPNVGFHPKEIAILRLNGAFFPGA